MKSSTNSIAEISLVIGIYYIIFIYLLIIISIELYTFPRNLEGDNPIIKSIVISY
jgi:hypothetical protein